MLRTDEPLTLRVSFLRYYATTMLPVVGGMLGGTAIVAAWAGEGAWQIATATVAGGTLGSLVVCAVRVARAGVELRDGVLDASGTFFRRLRVPLEGVDRLRSSQRTFWQRVAGERSLWTLDGRRVILNESWFEPGALMDLWVRLGCKP